MNYANGIVRDRASAEDVVQEAYLRFSAAAKDDQIVNPVSYLYRIVRNLAVDWTRRTSFEAPKVAAPLLDSVASDAPSAERILFFRDELRVISDALTELPERTRVAFMMYRLEGKTLQVIADHLGVSVVRVHQLVKEAILHAARRLDGSRN